MTTLALRCVLASSLVILVAKAEPVLEIRSSPEGPSYPAASWVRLACKFQQYPGNDIVYQWRMSCNRTGQVDSSTISPMMDEEGWAILWVHSTPLVCLDVFRCSVFRSSDAREGQAMASSVFKMDRVTGAGMSLYQGIFQGEVANNSVVVVQSHDGAPRELLCQSGLMKTSVNKFVNCSANWWSPSTTAVGQCARNLQDAEKEVDGMMDTEADSSNSTVTDVEFTYNSVRVDFSDGNFEDGLYSCTIQDENLEHWLLTVGVFKSVPQLSVDSSFNVTSEGYQLHCDSKGIPPMAILWYRNDILVSSSKDQSGLTNTADDGSAVYRHSWTVSSPGVYSCEIRTNWMMADRSSTGRISNSAFFVVHPTSPNVNLECAFPEGTTNVEWLSSSPESPQFDDLEKSSKHLKNNNVAILSLFLSTDDRHVFTCKGVDSSGHAQYKQYTVIVDVSLFEEVTSETKQSSSEAAGRMDPLERTILIGGVSLVGVLLIFIILAFSITTLVCVRRKKKQPGFRNKSPTLTVRDNDSLKESI